MRKILGLLCLGLALSTAGCATQHESTIFSSGYWKRHFDQIAQDFHEFRVDIDRTIFDLEDRPIEEQ